MIFILIIKSYYSRIFKVRASTNRSADIRQGRDLERTADFLVHKIQKARWARKEGGSFVAGLNKKSKFMCSEANRAALGSFAD